jgi:hypothetical protein
MTLSPLDIPQVRLAPSTVLAGLAAINPTLTFVHLSRDKWLLVYMAGTPEQVAQGQRLLANTRRILAKLGASRAKKAQHVLDARHDRLVIALVRAQGGIGLTIVRTCDPSGAVVEYARQRDYYQLNTTEADFWRQYDAIEAKAEAERIADLTDPARANDVWRNAHTLSHLVTRPNAPVRSSAKTLVRAIA